MVFIIWLFFGVIFRFLLAVMFYLVCCYCLMLEGVGIVKKVGERMKEGEELERL